MHLRPVLTGLLAAVIGLGATVIPDHPSKTERPDRGRTEKVTAMTNYTAPTIGTMPDILAVIEISREVFYTDVQRQIDEYLAAVHAAEVAAAEAEAARQRAVRSVPRSSPGTTVGACTGFVIPDYIIQRESGGNPSAYNPSGAYGCAQTLLSHYSSGSCSGLDPYSIEGQRECVYRLSNGGTNLNPWAATR